MPPYLHLRALLLPLLLLTGCQSIAPVDATLCTGEERHVLQFSTNPPAGGEVVAEHGLMSVRLSTSSASETNLYVEALDHLCLEPTDSGRDGELVTVRLAARGEVIASGDGEAMVLLNVIGQDLRRFDGYPSDNQPGSFVEFLEAEVELGSWFQLVSQVDIRSSAGSASAVLSYDVDGVVSAGGSPVSLEAIRSQSGTDY